MDRGGSGRISFDRLSSNWFWGLNWFSVLNASQYWYNVIDGVVDCFLLVGWIVLDGLGLVFCFTSSWLQLFSAI